MQVVAEKQEEERTDLAVIEIGTTTKKNTLLSDEEIQQLTDAAMVAGVMQIEVVRRWNQEHPDKTVSAAVLTKYVTHMKNTGEYFTRSKRGPKSLLTNDEEDRLVRLTLMTRSLG